MGHPAARPPVAKPSEHAVPALLFSTTSSHTMQTRGGVILHATLQSLSQTHDSLITSQSGMSNRCCRRSDHRVTVSLTQRSHQRRGGGSRNVKCAVVVPVTLSKRPFHAPSTSRLVGRSAGSRERHCSTERRRPRSCAMRAPLPGPSQGSGAWPSNRSCTGTTSSAIGGKARDDVSSSNAMTPSDHMSTAALAVTERSLRCAAAIVSGAA